MNTHIVSPQTRRAFRESWVTNSVIREIVGDFDDAGARRGELPPSVRITGERRQLVEEYYSTVDWTAVSSVQPILVAYEAHLRRLKQRGTAAAAEECEQLVKHLGQDKLSVVDDRIDLSAHDIDSDAIVDQALTVDVAQLHLNIRRIRDAISSDPALAIGSAKELVEATCKAILTERGKDVPPKAKLPELMHSVIEDLQLVSKNVPDEQKGAPSIRKVLGSLTQIVQGLAELRNLYGTGHGRGPGQESLTRRHAKLCAG